MKKVLRFFIVIKDILQNNQDGLLVKINFLYSITSHYLLKIFGINYCSFPEMNIKVDNCYFRTKKNTIDFWMVWRDYEKEIFNEIDSLPKEYSVFIDIGANLGRYSIIMAKRGLTVYSFGPLSSNFKQLKLNASLNNVEKNIQFHNIALGNNKTQKEIFFQKYKQGEASFLSKNGLQKEKVKIMPLDSIIINKKFKRKVIMKIDVEGYEYEILYQKIPKKINKISIEFHTSLLGKEKAKKLINYFYKEGFKTKNLIEGLPIRLYPFYGILRKTGLIDKFTFVKKDLEKKDVMKLIDKGRAQKYLFLVRKSPQNYNKAVNIKKHPDHPEIGGPIDVKKINK